MNAYSSEFHHLRSAARRGTPTVQGSANNPDLADGIARRWAALHSAAAAVVGLAQIAPGQASRDTPDFAGFIADSPRWKADLLRDGLDDIAAIMQAGLTALLAANAEAHNPSAAASALWAEFQHSRDALLEMLLGE